MSLDKKIDAVFSEMDEKSFRWGGLETYSLTRPLAKEKIRTLITAEIIAELERLLPEVDRYPDGTSPQWVTRIKDRIKQLSGGSNNE